MQSPSLRFSRVAQRVATDARRLGLEVPGFVAPPRRDGADRTIRRTGRGVIVAVRVRGRPFEQVVRDLVEGVLVANRLHGSEAERVRRALEEGAADVIDDRAA